MPRSSSACTSPGAPVASAITTRSSAASWRGSSPAATDTTAATLTEQQLLDLEREAFLSLCGERKTLDRIAHTLKTGKPLQELVAQASDMFDRGIGRPLLVIPGVQGRWEWMRPALDALSRSCRTLSYSLCGDLGSGTAHGPALGFDVFVRQLDDVLDRADLTRVALCGVSFGGTVARGTRRDIPSGSPAWYRRPLPDQRGTPNARQAAYIARPWSSVPAFCVTALDAARRRDLRSAADVAGAHRVHVAAILGCGAVVPDVAAG